MVLSLAAPMQLILGGSAGKIDGEPYIVPDILHMFTAGYRFNTGLPPEPHPAFLDSGAFSDKPENRLTPAGALMRQLEWEQKAGARWSVPWRARGLVSYDLLIDEMWLGGQKIKRRWTVKQAERAVQETVGAARYLSGKREKVSPRTLVLSAQGVDAGQYEDCARDVLAVAQPSDWFGLGGWCIIGRQRSLMPAYRETLQRVIPLVAQAGVRHVHIFGVLYRPAIGELQWMADQYGLTTSTDSTKPALCATFAQRITDPVLKAQKLKQAGAPYAYWRDNIAHFKTLVSTLRESEFYKEPVAPVRPLFFSSLPAQGVAR